ncbi:MAG: hypothetical protein SGI72_07305 [Planctomycetota bacterium]|nr:hypothetical protein [Planctomycetota bacterium]
MQSANDAAWIGFRSDSVFSGRVHVPGSKSIAQRFVIQAALASGTTRLTRLPDGDDVAAAVKLVQVAGATVERLAPAALSITGRPPGPHRGWKAETALFAGESGTLARLATAVSGFCALAGHRTEVRVGGTLAHRHSRALIEALRSAGVRIESADGATWPALVTPIGPPNQVVLREPRSSQEVSALLIALAAYPDALELRVEGAIPSRPYLSMTIAALAPFGVRVTSERAAHAGIERFEVHGPLRAPSDPIAIEPDASAAAVALAAGVLSKGNVHVTGLHADSSQGDVRIVEHLRAFGADAGFDDEGMFARGCVTRAADVDLENEPDLAPVVAALAACAVLAGHGPSRISGLGTLPGKESSRIDVLAAGLDAIGIAARASADALHVQRAGGAHDLSRPLDPHHDHRMAFAFALFGLCVEGVRVATPECVAKSWPSFWTDMERAGARLERQKVG